MSRTAIVYYGRHEPSVKYAGWLSDRLAALGRRAQLTPVTAASAHEVVFFDVVVLIGPMRWGRMHGIALARAVAELRPTAVLVTGTVPDQRVLRLFREHERENVKVFCLPSEAEDPTTVNPAAEWCIASAPGRRGPPRTLSG